MLKRDGRTMLSFALGNYAAGNLDSTYEMLQHPNVVFGLGDGGAHCATLCDASYSTFALMHWGRDRNRGPRLPLPLLVKAMTSATAQTVGLLDRGVVKPGYRADLNIIDFERLSLGVPRLEHDLPGGGSRLFQEAEGYTATIVDGVAVYRDGVPTGALPGRLVRGGQPAPRLQ
jgi:N-acyl-D-aspartate/D-glutamate deacylase